MARKRKNGQGTVRLRSDGRWEGRHIVGYDENGKAKQKSVLAKTKAECVEKLKKLQEEYTEVAPFKVKPDMRFGDWMNYWYENHCKPSAPLRRRAMRSGSMSTLFPVSGISR
jgi:hypothetical protein